MQNSKFFKSSLLALLFLALLAAVPALAYEDYVYNFSIKGPKNWIVLPNASVPGRFRFGWTSPEWAQPNAKNVWGASIAVFVQETEGKSAKELLDTNIEVISGKGELKPDPRARLKVAKQQMITVDGNQGFILEVVGNGTGFAIGVPATLDPKQKSAIKFVPTRQRWYCVVKGKSLIGVLSTCPDSLFAKYAPTFTATEATLKIR